MIVLLVLAALGIALGAIYALFIEKRPHKAAIYSIALALLLPTTFILLIALAPIIYMYIPPLAVAALATLALLIAVERGRRR